jgi:adenosylhomocysteinase
MASAGACHEEGLGAEEEFAYANGSSAPVSTDVPARSLAPLPTLLHHVDRFPCPPVSLVLLTHLLDTAVPFIDALTQATDVALVVAIPYSASPSACEVVAEQIRLVSPPTVSELPAHVRSELDALHSTARHPIVLQEIGGYCAPMLEDLAVTDNFLGVVEDTMQGHWRYAELPSLPRPVLSIAESPLKALENGRVGRSIAFALDTVLRRQFHRLPSDLRIGILGYGGIGEATAKALAAVGARIAVHDTCSIRMAKAAMDGFATPRRDDLLTESDVLLGVSGARSLPASDLDGIRDGAILASGSSKQVEIDIDCFRERWDLLWEEDAVALYERAGRRLWLLNDGMPVNFLEQSVLGSVLDLVYTELYMCIRELALGRCEPGLAQLDIASQREIADVWRGIHWPGGTR